MKRRHGWLVAIVVMCLIGLFVGAASAQTTVAKTQKFEVISVVGNQLVVRLPDGTKELTVPEDFRFTVDGKQLSVHDLKPGMAGEATTTTITKVRTVYVTEARNAKIMQANGNSVIVASADGKFKLFTQQDADKYKIQITRNGKPVEFQQLRDGDVVTATFVTPKDEVLTEQQVNARLATGLAPAAPAPKPAPAAPAPKPAPAAAPAPAPAAPPAAAPAPAAPKKLPKTASELPLIGLLGGLSLAIGASLTFVRRRRVAR